MKILILGASARLAPATIRALEPYHTLRLVDIKPVTSPHENRLVDISVFEQLDEAARGMDAIVNLTVERGDPIKAFDVNMRGTYNMMQSAVKNDIRRVIYTGPHTIVSGGDYYQNFEINEECIPRYTTGLYSITKFLGHEICRIFAEEYDIQVACLLFCGFWDSGKKEIPPGTQVGPFTVSWDDAGEAVRLAVEVESLPRRYEIFHIVADLPYRKYPIDKAKRLLGFQPKYNFDWSWRLPLAENERTI